MGQVFSTFLLGYAPCQIPAGMLADRFGARRVLALCALALVLTTIFMAAAGAFFLALLLARFLPGVAEAPTFPAAAAADRSVPDIDEIEVEPENEDAADIALQRVAERERSEAGRRGNHSYRLAEELKDLIRFQQCSEPHP